jgi:hypothetical protein
VLPASIERAIDRYSSARFGAGAAAEQGTGSSGDSPHRDELQVAIAAAVRVWQSAETAPRDGSHILAADFTPGAERLANESLRHLESQIHQLQS